MTGALPRPALYQLADAFQLGSVVPAYAFWVLLGASLFLLGSLWQALAAANKALAEARAALANAARAAEAGAALASANAARAAEAGAALASATAAIATLASALDHALDRQRAASVEGDDSSAAHATTSVSDGEQWY